MLSLQATIRNVKGRKTAKLRKEGLIPAVLYGPGIDNLSLEVSQNEFEKVHKEAGESSLVSLEVDSKKFDVLIHQIEKDHLSGKVSHIDFFHPSMERKIEAEIPLVFQGEAAGVKDLGGVLVREIQAVKVRGLAKDLPREITVAIGALETFEDRILVRDLKVPQGIEILRHQEEIVALVTAPKEEKEEEITKVAEGVVEKKPSEERKGKEETEKITN